MKTSVLTSEFRSDCETVWNVVTNNADTAWRSDLDHVEIGEDGSSFTEFSKGGIATDFVITEKEPCKHYAFTLENPYFTGSWSGTFESLKNGGTKIVFKEQLQMRNPVLRLFSLFMNLKKMQELYASDLRKKLGET